MFAGEETAIPPTTPIPRILVGSAVILAMLGCSSVLTPGDQGIEVTEEINFAFDFAPPTQVRVRPGDSLSKIGMRHNVSVDDLRAWNGLTTDVLEVDQVLILWEAAPELGSIDVASAGERTRAPAVAVAPKPTPKPSSTWRSAARSLFGGGAEPEPEPEPVLVTAKANPGEQGEPVQVAAVDSSRRSINVDRGLLKGSGILDADMGTDAGIDLARSASGMSRHESSVGKGGLSGRSLADGGTGEALEVDRQLSDYGVQIPNKPVKPPRLSKPSAKRCKSGPSATMDEMGMVTNNGLNAAEISMGMAGISRHTMRCFPKGTLGTYQVNVEVKVGCNGLVDNVYTIGAGEVPGHVTSCIEEVLSYASFAAHAVPDGQSFQYPLKFSF